MVETRDFLYTTRIRRPRWGEELPSEYCHNVYEKKQNGESTRYEKSLRICLVVSIQYTNVTDGRTDGRTDRHR